MPQPLLCGAIHVFSRNEVVSDIRIRFEVRRKLVYKEPLWPLKQPGSKGNLHP